ncbi:HCP-like protein [Testicularia cyperi]|uniref:HCP-like protein n=1 Tax=Testicularia cyperi TaxID=1882483 RepID=A0A317XPZ6_9BASI|nr:HCP-like protein [Testicularia cyperi]
MATPAAPAYAFHNRFDMPPANDATDGNGPSAVPGQARLSSDNFSFPDLDAGRYHSSAGPNATAPSVTNLPDFEEFKGFDRDPPLFQNNANHFHQFAPQVTHPAASVEPQSAQIEELTPPLEDVSTATVATVPAIQAEPAPPTAPSGTVPAALATVPSESVGTNATAAAEQPNHNPQLERHFSSASSYIQHAPISQQISHDSQPASRHSHSSSRSPLPVPPPVPTHAYTSVDAGSKSSNSHHSHHSQAVTAAHPAIHAPIPARQSSFVFPAQAQPTAGSVRGAVSSTQHASVLSSGQTHAHPDSLGMDAMRISDGDRQQPKSNGERARPSSFFGMERPTAAINASGQQVPLPPGMLSDDDGFYQQHQHHQPQQGPRPPQPPSHSQQASVSTARPTIDTSFAQHSGASAQGPRPSSFFGGLAGDAAPSTVSADLTTASALADDLSAIGTPTSSRIMPGNHPRSDSVYRGISTAAGGTGNGPMPSTPGGFGGLDPSGATRPASIAPSVGSGPLLDHSHLKVGQRASLLSHDKTLELYRQNAKKTNDPNLIYELAVFMIDAAKTMGADEGVASQTNTASPGPKPSSQKDELLKEATGLLKKIADRGHPDAQYFLADCYANGMGTRTGKQDFSQAYTYFVLSAKHGHPDAAYRAGTCYEKGWGCRKDNGKALQFYRKSAAQSHPGAMYRLATAELNGELGLKKNAKEGVKWLKRSAEAATPEFPHALHELALLHERGIDNVLFVDPEYSCELLAQAGEMGYAPSAYKLGVNYEYGRMGCPQDGGLSIHMYNIAAQQNHKEACFALTAWYLVGAPGILPQSDTEAYLWAKKAAEQGLAKAEYAVGYFTEMGIGTVKDIAEAKAWYRRAADHGDKRANQRIAALQGRGGPNTLAGVGAGAGGAGGAPAAAPPNRQQLRQEQRESMHDFGRRGQPTSAPFPSLTPSTPQTQMNYPTPIAMREAQTAQREQQYMANVAANERAQARAMLRHSPSQGDIGSQLGTPASPSSGLPRPPPMMGNHQQQHPTQPFSQPQAYPSYPATASNVPPANFNGPMPGPGPMSNAMPPPQASSLLPQGPTPPAKADLGQDDKKKKKGWFSRS